MKALAVALLVVVGFSFGFHRGESAGAGTAYANVTSLQVERGTKANRANIMPLQYVN